MYKFYCRVYQGVFRVASYLLPWRKPKLLEGEGTLNQLPSFMKGKGLDNLLIVTDKNLISLGLMDGLIRGLEAAGFKFVVFDKTVPNRNPALYLRILRVVCP